MTRSELTAALAQRFPQLVQKGAEMAVAEILGAIAAALSAGNRVEIRGFGSFSLNYRPPRTGRNPKTGEKVRYIPPTLPALPPRIDNHLLEAVQEALLTDHQIEVEYRKPSSEMPQSLCLHPLALLQRGTITYLAATAFGYNDIRLYALHRMAAAEVLPEKSLHPACFSLDAYLDSGALQFTNGKTIVFKAWVQESLAAILRETPLGTDQTLEKRGERSLLRVTIKDSWQLVWWVLSQGEMIEVLSPCNLRSQIADVASNMHSQYSDNRIEEEDEHS